MLRPDNFGDVDLQRRGIHNDAVIAAAWMCAIDDRLRSGTTKLTPTAPISGFYSQCRARFPNDAKPHVAAPARLWSGELLPILDSMTEKPELLHRGPHLWNKGRLKRFPARFRCSRSQASRCTPGRSSHRMLSASIFCALPFCQTANEEEVCRNLTTVEVLPRLQALSLDRPLCFC